MTQEIGHLYRQHLNPDLARLMKFGGPGSVEERAQGSRVVDHLGREFLDLAGGYGVFSLGHCHPVVIQAVQEQLQKLPLSSKLLFNAEQAHLAQELAQLAPGQLQYCFFCNSGTEAVEGALKLARLATGRPKFIACEQSYHGKTLGALSVTGRPTYRQPFEPLLPEVEFVPFGDLSALEAALSEKVAAFIVEPIQGEGGIHVAPEGYLRGVQALCHRQGALWIADEVQSGLGRTGRMFAVEHWGVEPDLMVLAKALGGGVLPIGAILGTPEVWKSLKGQPLIHTSTFGGNPLACVAARATLRVLEQEELPQLAAESGGWFKSQLEELAKNYPTVVSQVRGMGLMLGVELGDEGRAGSVISELVRHRILTAYTLNQPRVIRLEPPLNIQRCDLEWALVAWKEALEATYQRFCG